MKKWVAILLALAVIWTLAGCNQAQSDDNETTGIKESEPLGQTTGTVTDEVPEESALSRGTFDGAVYTNKYLGFQFEKPQSWVYSTDEEIAAMINMTVDNILGDNFKDALEKSPTVYDMMVVDTVTRSNINIGYENLFSSLSTNITIDQYAEAVKRQFSSIEGMTVTFPETYDTVKLGGSEFTRIVCTVTVDDVSMSQAYYLQKKDIYMAFVIVTVTPGCTLDEIEAMFH